jgi:bifunctional DNA-binding transcriptional regulator/antitoxin component of YhaV-PrlF toxin-antitoxin module
MKMSRLLKVSKGGQVSVPAAIRHRWHARNLLVEDHGDHLVLRPAPDNPLDAIRGIFADRPGPSSDEMRRELREQEAEIEERKYGHLGPGSEHR